MYCRIPILMQRGLYHSYYFINIVCSRVNDSSPYRRGDIPLSCSSAHPFLCGHRDNHFRTRRTKYILGINFRQNPTTLKFYGAGGTVRVMSSGMTRKMNRTMYLLFIMFLERSGHLETVANVSTSKCVPDTSTFAP